MEFDYLVKPAGIVKGVAIVFGIVILGCSIASRPSELLKELGKLEESVDLWKYDFFLAIVVIGLLVSISSLVLFVVRGSKPDFFRLLDAGSSVLIGLMMVIASGLLMGEVMWWYNDISGMCPEDSTKSSKAQSPAATLSSIVDDQLNIYEKCDISSYVEIFRSEEKCLCYIKGLLKFELSIASGALGIIGGVNYFIGALLAILK